jgi:hypothetical protein
MCGKHLADEDLGSLLVHLVPSPGGILHATTTMRLNLKLMKYHVCWCRANWDVCSAPAPAPGWEGYCYKWLGHFHH